MGWPDAFAWQTPAAVFREHAALSGHANDGRRIFDIGAMADLDDAGFEAMQSFRWPLPAGASSDGGRLFAQGGFATPDGRGRFVPTRYQPLPRAGNQELLLNTGRVRDQWHTMTRTGLAASLMSHTSEPMLSIHPADAAALGVEQDALTRVVTAHGEVLLRADIRRTQRHGEVFAPMHWTDQFASTGSVGRVVSAKVDPVSGQPELKATFATVQPVTVHFHGLLLRRSGGVLHAACHWVRIPIDEGQLYRLAGLRPMPEGEELSVFAAALLDVPNSIDWLEMSDSKRGVLRIAAIIDGALDACLFLARDAAALPNAAAVTAMLGAPVPDAARSTLLAGRMYAATADEGPRICACFGVTRDAIRHAVVTQRLGSVKQIGALLKAGTNCGSCIPELEEILRDVRMPAD